MRKALFLIGLAAGVAAMPMSASAQDRDHHEHGGGNNGGGHRGGGGGGGGGNRGGGGGGNWRGGQQQQPQQQQAQPQQQQQQQVQAPQRSEWMGDRNNPRMEAARQRYERLERENARNYGTPQQTREVIDRQRAERQNDRGNWQGNNNRPNWNGGRFNDNRPGWNGGRNDNRPNWNGGRNDGRPGWNGNRGRNTNWNRDWRNDRRFDWQRYRSTNRFVFHVQPYYAPYRNWSYTRFGIGMFLDELLYSQNYWINDPWTYRLPPAEPGLHWVRYYNDVLLVDDYSGEVVDVIYDFFW